LKVHFYKRILYNRRCFESWQRPWES